MNLIELVYYLKLFRNDIYHIHVHAAGSDFDKVHNLAEELYTELDCEIDELAEMGVSEGLQLQNLTSLKSIVSDWEEENKDAYFWEDFIQFFSDKGNKILKSINDTKTDNKAHQNYLDDVLQFWDKQVAYKNELRKLETNTEATYIDAQVEIEDQKEFLPDDDDATGLENLQTDLMITGGIQIDPLASQMFTSPYETEQESNDN